MANLNSSATDQQSSFGNTSLSLLQKDDQFPLQSQEIYPSQLATVAANAMVELVTQAVPPVVQAEPKDNNNEDDGSIALLIGLPLVILVLLFLIISAIIVLCRLYRAGSLEEVLEKSWVKKTEQSDWLPNGKKGEYDFTSVESIPKKAPEIVHTVDLYRTEKSKASMILAPQEKLYKALYNFDGKEDGMLSLKLGMQVEVIDKQQDWWKGTVGLHSGWFPSSYVEPLKPELTEEEERNLKSYSRQSFNGEINLGLCKSADDMENARLPPVTERSLSLPASFTADKPESSTWWAAYRLQNIKNKGISPDVLHKEYLVKYIYKPNASDELSVKPGDMLLHLNRDPNGWIKVRNRETGEEGWVPGACVLDSKEAKKGESVAEEMTGVCLCDYEKRYEGDISFNTGDKVIVIEKLDSGWWRGIVNDTEGWFPGSYIQVGANTPSSEDSGYLSSPQIPPPVMFADMKMNLDTVIEDANESSTDDLVLQNSNITTPNIDSKRSTTPSIRRENSTESNLSFGKPRKPPRNITRPSIPAPPPPTSPSVIGLKKSNLELNVGNKDSNNSKLTASENKSSVRTPESDVVYKYLKKTFDGVLYPSVEYPSVDESKIFGKDDNSPSGLTKSNSEDNIYESFDLCLNKSENKTSPQDVSIKRQSYPYCVNKRESQEIEKTNEYFSNSLKKGVPVATVKPVSNSSLNKICNEKKVYSEEITSKGKYLQNQVNMKKNSDANDVLELDNMELFDKKDAEEFQNTITFLPDSESETGSKITENESIISDMDRATDFHKLIMDFSDEEDNKASLNSSSNLILGYTNNASDKFDGFKITDINENNTFRHSFSSSRGSTPPLPPLPDTYPPFSSTNMLDNNFTDENNDYPFISPSDSNLSEMSKTLRSSYFDLNFDVSFDNLNSDTDSVATSDPSNASDANTSFLKTDSSHDVSANLNSQRHSPPPMPSLITMLSSNSPEHFTTNGYPESSPNLSYNRQMSAPITSLREKSKSLKNANRLLTNKVQEERVMDAVNRSTGLLSSPPTHNPPPVPRSNSSDIAEYEDDSEYVMTAFKSGQFSLQHGVQMSPNSEEF